MKRFFKWLALVVLVSWLLLSTTVTLLGYQYVYAFEILPLFYEEETLHMRSTAALEVRVPRPREPEEPIRIDVHSSPLSALRFLKRCLHVQNPDFCLFTRDDSSEIELYVISHERGGKTEVHKAVFVGILHQHERAKMVVLD